MPQGAYHAHELVVLDGRSVVLRRCIGSQWGLEASQQLAREFAVLEALEPTAVAPRPVALEGDVLIEEFVAGRSFDPRSDLIRLMPALRAIHSTPPPATLPRVDAVRELHADGRRWMERARVAGAPDEQLRALGELALALPAPFDAGSMVLVHTDLNAGNLLVESSGAVRVLDWEAARVGPAAWDLAHLLAPTTTLWDSATACVLDRPTVSAALAAYGDQTVTRHVAKLSSAVRFRAQAWVVGARAEGIAANNFALASQLDRLIDHLLHERHP
ncbi:MAG: phosphotransferase [Solirubrobacterales bacterium]